MSDISIAQAAKKKPIVALAQEKLGIYHEHLIPYGHYKAKISLEGIQAVNHNKEGKLILVTAMSPTPAGEGKTTTTVGLGDAMNSLGHKTIVCLREPSLGPCFGMKGGAAGGGYAQVVPMEDINLHFTGDFHAITSAHNLLSALVDNHITHGNSLSIDPSSIAIKRVVDMNDRALRNIVSGLGGSANGFPRESGFDITVASEVMAIFCLSTSIKELKSRLGKIIVGYSLKNEAAITATDLKAEGAMTALLKDAISPNIVQTLENNIAFVHGGPFANIAHGCNSVTATKAALKLGDYVITEAGFGADLGAEKFVDIKCRLSGLKPQAVVLVATVRALKYHGGVTLGKLTDENIEALETGFENLKRHVKNITEHLGLSCIVSINHFTQDTEAEISKVISLASNIGVKALVSRHWELGGKGAKELAVALSELVKKEQREHRYVYESEASLWDKIETIAHKIYCAENVMAAPKVRQKIEKISAEYPLFPVCIAKTQMSFSSDPKLLGAPVGHTLEITNVQVLAGAGFVVAIAGNMMTMPGLPRSPAAERITVDDNGNIKGLF